MGHVQPRALKVSLTQLKTHKKVLSVSTKLVTWGSLYGASAEPQATKNQDSKFSEACVVERKYHFIHELKKTHIRVISLGKKKEFCMLTRIRSSLNLLEKIVDRSLKGVYKILDKILSGIFPQQFFLPQPHVPYWIRTTNIVNVSIACSPRLG